MVGLDIAGIDFICPDITEPVRETGGAICEVNAAPGLPDAHPPDRSASRSSSPSRSSTCCSRRARRAGSRSSPSPAPTARRRPSRMIAHIFKGMGRKVGMTSTDGVVIDERLVIRADASGPAVGADGAAEPARRLRGLRGRPRRHPARGPRLRAQRRRRGAQRAARPPRPARHRHRRAARRRQGGRSSRRCRATGTPCSTPTTRWCARCGAAARARSSGSRWTSPAREARDMIDAHCRRGGKALVLEPDRARRDDRRQARPRARCSWPGPTCCPRPSAAGPG